METKSSKFIFILLLIISSTLASTQAYRIKRQSHALADLYKSKFFDSKNEHPSGRSFIDGTVGDDDDVSDFKFEVLPQEGLKEKDKIERLPGQPDVNFTQYGGYITIDKKAGRAFYYYFVEAEENKDSLPLLLWLNGGPGCSSIAYGAMEELGPFRVHSDGKTLFRNPYAWNRVANVLFLESPAGVGFSYSNTTSDYASNGDKKTARDNCMFLLNWFERFPEYRDREFYIAGESYAGHYVPQLAHQLLVATATFNLKGIIIGNAVLNDETDERGMYDFFISHALVSDQVSARIKKYCNFSAPQSNDCNDATAEALANLGNIDIYNIYYPICKNLTTTPRPKRASVFNFDPCSDAYVYAYMNNPRVQKALHANVTKLNFEWQPCSDVIQGWTDGPPTVLPLLQEFMRSGLRVWVFSGDVDGRVPVTSTQYSLRVMNLTVKASLHPWYYKGQVGGYAEEYEGRLTFATVRGAGHEVPSYQPGRALSLIKNFLAGTPLPNQ